MSEYVSRSGWSDTLIIPYQLYMILYKQQKHQQSVMSKPSRLLTLSTLLLCSQILMLTASNTEVNANINSDSINKIQIEKLSNKVANVVNEQLPYCGAANKRQFVNQLSAHSRDYGLEARVMGMFPAQKNLLVQGIINNRVSQVFDSLRPNIGMYILHIGIIAFFGLMFVILLPVLLCTRCCLVCCQKPSNESYTKYELRCPAIMTVLLLLALIAICILAIFYHRNSEKDFQTLKCSLPLVTGSLLDGAHYYPQHKFMGLRNFSNRIDNLLQNLTQINRTLRQNFTLNSKPIMELNEQLNNMLNITEYIPSNTKQKLILLYPRPLTAATPQQLQSSLFPSVLGTSRDSNTLVGNFTSTIKHKQATTIALNSLANNFTNFSKTVNSSLSKIKLNLESSIKPLEQIQLNIYSTVDIAEKGIYNVVRILGYVILGLTIFFAVIIAITICCLNSNSRCNGYVCTCCILLWLIGILHFAIAIFLSLANAGLIHGCDYAREGLSSQNAFKENFFKFVPALNADGQYKQITSMIGKCLATSKDPLLMNQEVLNKDLIDNITKFNKIITSYSPKRDAEQLSQNYTNLTNIIQQYRSARILDIANNTMIQELIQMSKIRKCWPDSWVPSIRQNPEIIKCDNVGTQSQRVDKARCNNLNSFVARDQTCAGCIDSFQLTQQFNNVDQLSNVLNQRYSSCVGDEKATITNFKYIWSNFYDLKKSVIGQVLNNARKVQVPLNSTKRILVQEVGVNYKKIADWIQNQPLLKTELRYNNNSALNENQTQANNTSSSTPILTLEKQMDCRVFGKNLNNSLNLLCVQGIYYSYMLRIFYVTSALLIFFICLSTICVFSRYHHQRNLVPEAQYPVNNQIVVPSSQRRFTMQQLQVINHHGYFQR